MKLSIRFGPNEMGMPVLYVDGLAAAYVSEMELAPVSNEALAVSKLAVYPGQIMGRPMVDIPPGFGIEAIGIKRPLPL
jgi:hypothetical protein